MKNDITIVCYDTNLINRNGETLLYQDFIEKVKKHIPNGIEPIEINAHDFERYSCSKYCIDTGFKAIIAIYSNDEIHLLQEFKKSMFHRVQKLLQENKDFKIVMFKITTEQFYAINYILLNFAEDYVNPEERFKVLLSSANILFKLATNTIMLAVVVVSIMGAIYYNYSNVGIKLGTISSAEMKAIFEGLLSGTINNIVTWIYTLSIIFIIIAIYLWRNTHLENVRSRISTFHFIYFILRYPVSATIKIVFSLLAIYIYFFILHDIALNTWNNKFDQDGLINRLSKDILKIERECYLNCDNNLSNNLTLYVGADANFIYYYSDINPADVAKVYEEYIKENKQYQNQHPDINELFKKEPANALYDATIEYMFSSQFRKYVSQHEIQREYIKNHNFTTDLNKTIAKIINTSSK